MSMTKYAIEVRFDCCEGALVRLLGLIERRGFVVEAVNMPQGGDTISLRVAPVDGNRQIEILKRQIERLQEVRDVSLAVPVSARPRRILAFLAPERERGLHAARA